jgi:hypothetical protein
MRYLSVLFALACSLLTVQAFAHHGGKSGPCSAYQATCLSDPSVTGATDKRSKWAAMHGCVSAAAKADTGTGNGQKCLDLQAKSKGPGVHGSVESPGPAATPAESKSP